MALNSHVNKITAAANGRQATGWRIYASNAYSSIKKRNDSWQKRCSNGGKNWWGWCDGNCGGVNHIGSIETTLKGCGTAKLNFGNCYDTDCNVNAYIDGKIIDTASKETPHKVVTFEFKEGSKLKISNARAACMMIFNNFEVISCSLC